MPDRPLKPLEARERLATRVWGIAFAVLYWISRTEAHTVEEIASARTIRDGSFAAQFLPRHLLYGPGLWGLWRGLSLIHPHLDPLSVAAFTNSMLSGLTLLVFARCLLENGATYFWTSFATLGLGLSQCMWTIASENEAYPAALLFLVLAGRDALRATHTGLTSQMRRAGLWVAAASMFHVVAALFILPLAVLGSRVGVNPARRARAALVAVSSALLPLLAVYALALALSGAANSRLAWAWFVRHIRWGSLVERNPLHLALGFLWFLRGAIPDFGLIGRATNPTASPLLNDLAQLPFILFTAAVLYLAMDGVRKRAYLSWRFDALPLLCAAWFLTFELFLGWVGRSSLKFWVLTLPPLWAFCAIWADLRFGDPEGQGLRRMSHRAAFATLLILGVEILTTGFLVVAPRHDQQQDAPRRWSENLTRITQPGDYILVPENELAAYLGYFGRRDNLATLESLARSTRSYEATLDSLEAGAARARRAGYRPLFTAPGLAETPDAARLWNRPWRRSEVYDHFAPRLARRALYDLRRGVAAPANPLEQPGLFELLPDTSGVRPGPPGSSPTGRMR